MKPLHGKTILITRDSSQTGSLKDKLEALGAEIISIPTIRIADPPDWLPFDQAAQQVDRFDWLVFTSVNAVSQTHKRLLQLGYRPEALTLPKIAVVGDQTGRQVEAMKWRIDFIPDSYQAENLASGMVARGVAGKKIWFPRALEARSVLIDELEQIGATVTLTPVYQNTIPLENRENLRQTLDNLQVDWITFTSSSTVTNFFKILDRDTLSLSLPRLASIGKITTKTLLAFSLKPEFTAEPQNLDGLCQGIAEYESS
jgi:uroporphyrinogen III methyltransferase/synthase